MKAVMGGVLFVLILAVLGYAGWQFKRHWNYSWGYEAMVEETAERKVCEMVKPEYLKNPERC